MNLQRAKEVMKEALKQTNLDPKETSDKLRSLYKDDVDAYVKRVESAYVEHSISPALVAEVMEEQEQYEARKAAETKSRREALQAAGMDTATLQEKHDKYQVAKAAYNEIHKEWEELSTQRTLTLRSERHPESEELKALYAALQEARGRYLDAQQAWGTARRKAAQTQAQAPKPQHKPLYTKEEEEYVAAKGKARRDALLKKWGVA